MPPDLHSHSCYPEQLADGLPAHAPQKLYYSVLARSAGSQLRAYMKNAGINFSPAAVRRRSQPSRLAPRMR